VKRAHRVQVSAERGRPWVKAKGLAAAGSAQEPPDASV